MFLLQSESPRVTLMQMSISVLHTVRLTALGSKPGDNSF